MPKANGVPHFMPVAVQDLHGSSILKRAVNLGRRDLWFLYLQLLPALWDAGGTLPSDPEALSEMVWFFTPKQIAELLPLLKPLPGSRGGIVVEGDTCHQPRVTQELLDRAAFSAQAQQMGRARAASAKRGPDGRLKASPGGPKWGQKGSFERGEKGSEKVSKTEAGPPPKKARPASSVTQALDQPSASVDQPTSSSPYPFPYVKPDLCEKAAAGGKGGAGGNGDTDPPPPPHSAPPDERPLLDHNPDVGYERELAEVCRQVVEARGRGDEYAVLREITATSRGKRMDSIWGASEGWCRRSIGAGQAILAQLKVPQMGQLGTVSEMTHRTADERRASTEAGMALIRAAAGGRVPDIALAGGKALVVEPEPYRPNLGLEGPDVTPQTVIHEAPPAPAGGHGTVGWMGGEHDRDEDPPPEALTDAPEVEITLERAEDEP